MTTNEAMENIRTALKPSQGLVLKSPSNQGKMVKLWLASETNLCYRVIESKKDNPDNYQQGELRMIPLSLIDAIKPLNDKTLLIDTSCGKPLTLETVTLEELSLLTIGLQALSKATLADVNGGAPPGDIDDADVGVDAVFPPPANAFRLVCWKLVTFGGYFDILILVCIAINCIFMAIEDPNYNGGGGDDDEGGNILYLDIKYKTGVLIGRILLWIFTIESLLKCTAYLPWGYFFGPDANWNRLDFFIVMVGWLEEYPQYMGAMPFNLSFLRIFRVFRPLRTLGKMDGMKELISTMFVCFDPLVDVLSLTIFIFFVFSVLGMELFQGQGSQRCILPGPEFDKDDPFTSDWQLIPTYNAPTEIDGPRTCGGDYVCPTVEEEQVVDGVSWGYIDGVEVPAGEYKCYHLGRNPSKGILKQNQADGIIGFDNLGQAMLTVFVFCTLEGWVDGMYQFQDSFNWFASVSYFILLILLGTFFCMNLALAVISDTFEEEYGEEDEENDDNKKNLNDDDDDDDDDEAHADGPTMAPMPEDMFSGYLHTLSYNSIFNNSIVSFIILNAITLAMEHVRRGCLPINSSNQGGDWSVGEAFLGATPDNDDGFCIVQAVPMTTGLQTFLRATNLFFVAVFAFECVVKMIGMRPKFYFRDPFNTFDFVIVAVSFLEIAIQIKGLTALRCFRLARVFKMARSWKSLRAIIESLLKALPAMSSLGVMLLLYLFIASVAGMQLLGNRIPYDQPSRFTDFGSALLTVFQMLTGEDWNAVMFEAIKGTKKDHHYGYWIVIYFVLIVLVGAFLVLNLFLAIMLADFNCGEPPDFSLGNAMKTFCPFLLPVGLQASGEELSHQAMVVEGTLRKSDDRKEELQKEGKHGSAEMVTLQKELQEQRKKEAVAEREKLHGVSLGIFPVDSPVRRALMKLVRDPNFDALILFCIIFGSVILAVNGPTNDDTTTGWVVITCYLDGIFVVIFTFEMVSKMIVQGFYWCPEGYLKDPWNILDFVVVIVGWLTSDCILPVPEGASAVGALRTLRSLRALRPLRTIQRMPGMRLVVMVLFECTPVFVNICMIVFFVFAVFAIMGVQFFKGLYWQCNDGDVSGVDECYGCFADDEGVNPTENCPDGESERAWENFRTHFDNVWTSLLTLYEVAGLEMWLDIMYYGMNSNDACSRKTDQAANCDESDVCYGCQPQYERRWYAALYFVLFILVGVFIVMNLFVGAVVDKFNELKEANGGRSPLQTEEQAQYSESMALMARLRPFKVPLPPQKPRKNGVCVSMITPIYTFRMACYKIVMWDASGKGMGTSFDMGISALVMGNIIVMGMYQWRRLKDGQIFRIAQYEPDAISEYQDAGMYRSLELLNLIFTALFFVEMLLKFAAWGLKQYFADYWNELDCFLVVTSVLGVFAEYFLTSGVVPLNPAVFRIIRVARLTRALKSIRMVRRIKGVARLVDTLVIAIPAMANVASLCFLVIFIFAVMGMDFFGKDQIDGPDAAPINGGYNQWANFRYFGDAFTLLFRTVTGEWWNGVMHDMMVAECDPSMYPDKDKIKPGDKEYDEHWCGAPHGLGPVFFFVLFQTLVTGLLFELITAIVLDEFSKMNENEKLPVNSDMIANFNDHWAQLDPKATQMIPQYKLLPFLKSVEPPIFEDGNGSLDIFKMNIAATDQNGVLSIHYVDTLLAVVRYQYVKQLGEDAGEMLDVTMIESPELTTRIISAYPHLKAIEEMEPKDFKKELAATKMQNIFMRKRARQRIAAQKRQLQLKVAKIRGIKMKNNGKVPEIIERLSVDEMMVEWRANGNIDETLETQI